MRTVLAYLLVIPLVQFAYTLGFYLGTPAGLPFWVVPGRLGDWVRRFVDGSSATLTGVAYGFVVFRLIAGAGSFGVFPVLAAVVPLAIPISNDYWRRDSIHKGDRAYLAGTILGIGVGGVLFVTV